MSSTLRWKTFRTISGSRTVLPKRKVSFSALYRVPAFALALARLVLTCDLVVVKYIKSTSLPTTYLYTCTPFSDVLHHLSKSSDEDYLLSFPITDETAMPGFPVEQTGEWVKVAIAKPDKWVGTSTLLFPSIIRVRVQQM
jgi:hypothetical protein